MTRAALLYGPLDIRIEDMPDEEPGPGELLLDVTAVGICGSDLHSYLSGGIGGTVAVSPLVLGHEAAGRVAKLGPGLTGKFSVGQPVAIDPAIHCGECEQCMNGRQHLCTRMQFIGLFPRHGALRRQMVHPAEQCIALPDGMDPITAALLEPLGVALHASRLAKVAVDEDVLVLGCGAIGLLLIQLVRLAGAKRIFAADQHEWRLEMARRFGADFTVNANSGNIVALVNEVTANRGVDVAIESAWVADTADQCLEATRPAGRVVIVGIPAEDVMTMRASTGRRKELSIEMSRRMNHVYSASIALVTRSKINVAALATHRFTLDQSAEALDTAANYRDGVIRAMVLPNP